MAEQPSKSVIQAQVLVPDYQVELIEASGDGTRLAVSGRTEQSTAGETTHFVDILDATTLQILATVDIGAHQPNMMDVSPDATWIVYNVPYTELRAINTLTGESALLYGGGPSEVGALDWSPSDGRLAYAVFAGISIAQFYGELPASGLIDEGAPGLVNALAWSPNGDALATTTYFAPQENPFEGTANLQLWREAEIDSGPIVTAPSVQFSGGGSRILVWSPTDEFLASGYRDGVALLDVATGQWSHLLTPNGEPSDSIAWSPDGTRIAAGGLYVTWVWDVSSGQIVDKVIVDGLVDALVWLPSVGLVHNGAGDGLYLNDRLVTDPITITPTPPPTT